VIKRLNSQNQQCPDQKFALVGYSQGAAVMHIAVSPNDTVKISPQAMKQVVGGAMFGDPALSRGNILKGLPGLPPIPGMPPSVPDFPDPLNKNVKENCAISFDGTDPVC
jgi:hypothetical protein